MVYKQDFTNVLDLEIERLESEKRALEGELKARIKLFQNAVFITEENPGSIEFWENEKKIVWLKNDIRSKKDFLFKLNDKKLHDVSELDSEEKDMLENKDSVLLKLENAILDEHDTLRLNYMKNEFLLWHSKPDTDPSKKEASVFYYKGILMGLAECGVK